MSEVSQSQDMSGSGMLPLAWESLFEAIEDGVCVQSLDSRIVRANRAFAEMVGLPPAQIVRRTLAEVFSWAHGTDGAPAHLAGSLSGQTAGEEFDGRRPGQRLHARLSPARDEQGNITAYVMVVRDITEAVAHELEIARVEQRARFGELAAGLAHEIKNPLAGIQGAVDILIGRRTPDDPEHEVLRGVRREVGRINNTVQMLLDRARPRALKIRPAFITEAVERAVNLARASLTAARKEQVHFDINPASSLVTMPIDVVQLEDAVLNLLLNAIEAIDGEGAITVRVYETAPDGEGEEVVIEVADTGRGIGQEDLKRIFSPFYTTHPAGTGLGLPAVRGVARAHGGRVEVSSAMGAGSTFSLRLPRKRRQL